MRQVARRTLAATFNPLSEPEPPVVSGRYRATQSGIGRLTRGPLVIVGAEGEIAAETRQLMKG